VNFLKGIRKRSWVVSPLICDKWSSADGIQKDSKEGARTSSRMRKGKERKEEVDRKKAHR